jgi:A/G-specific adenine glycosylase
MFAEVTNILIDWFLKNKRDLPWRHTSDPYKIWISEIILQQTRVEQGLPYYEQFVGRYPDVSSLANANDDDVMKLWQGLGYYSRARNLLDAARAIQALHKGKFPESHGEIKKLRGIGDYTAAAIASFAFHQKYPVLDGNVYRFITRLYGIETPIDKAVTKKAVLEVLHALMAEVNDPGTLNQALMEMGALLCIPRSPDCRKCPLSVHCMALKMGKVDNIPVKGKPIKVTDRYLNYIVIVRKNRFTYIKKRTEKDVWHNLYDFPLIETARPVSLPELKQRKAWKELMKNARAGKTRSLKPVVHKLSHQNLFVTFHIVNISGRLDLKYSPIFEIEKNIINSFAVPRVIEKFLHSDL